MEEKADEYLEDLVKRNLVIVNSRKMNGKIRSCSLHDMVRDVCTRKARDEKFLRVMDGRVVHDFGETIGEKHMSLMLTDMDSFLVPTTRTIMRFNPNDFSNLQDVLGRFILLRVFHDAGVSHQMPSPQVFELFYLRYLTFKGSMEITSAISNLVNLQTLIILPPYHYQKRTTWRYEHHGHASDIYFPLEILRLPQLRHLVLYDLYILPHPPNGLKSDPPLANLQTLFFIKNLVWSEKIVEMIPNVKRLGLIYAMNQEHHSMNQEYHLNYLKYLLKLEKLQVSACGDFFWQGRNPSFPTTLKKLTLVGGEFPWTKMYIIGSLPKLQVLKLLDHACNGETWETGDDEFPQLKYLLIETSCLRQWTTESTSFRVLERLALRSCRNIEMIPEEIGEIYTLEVIEVGDCRECVVEAANHIKELKQTEGDDDNFQVQTDRK